MSKTSISKSNFLFTILGSLGAILIFALILFLAYLPNRPDPVDSAVVADRQAKADESRAAGIKKLSSLELIDSNTGIVRIPIEDAMRYTVEMYKTKKVTPSLGETKVVSDLANETAEQINDVNNLDL